MLPLAEYHSPPFGCTRVARQVIVAISDREPPRHSAWEAITPKGSNLGRTNGPDPWEPVDHTAKPHHHNFSARVRAISAVSDRNRLTRSL